MNTQTLEKKENFKVSATVDFVVHDKHGNLKKAGKNHNLVMNVGKAAIAALLGNTGGVAAFGFLAVGSSTTAVANTQTTLAAEITTNGLARAAAIVSLVTTTSTNDTLQFSHQWTVSGNQDINEVAPFNASSGGTMLGRALLAILGLVVGDLVTVIYKVQFS